MIQCEGQEKLPRSGNQIVPVNRDGARIGFGNNYGRRFWEVNKLDVRKKAEQLADAILNSPEYKKMIEARDKVQEHQAAQMMLRDFQRKQEELHKQQMEGTPITPQQEEELQQLLKIISVNPYIRDLFEAEFVFSGLMMEINDILASVLDLKDEDEGDNGESKIEVPKKKILIPGEDI